MGCDKSANKVMGHQDCNLDEVPEDIEHWNEQSSIEEAEDGVVFEPRDRAVDGVRQDEVCVPGSEIPGTRPHGDIVVRQSHLSCSDRDILSLSLGRSRDVEDDWSGAQVLSSLGQRVIRDIGSKAIGTVIVVVERMVVTVKRTVGWTEEPQRCNKNCSRYGMCEERRYSAVWQGHDG